MWKKQRSQQISEQSNGVTQADLNYSRGIKKGHHRRHVGRAPLLNAIIY